MWRFLSILLLIIKYVVCEYQAYSVQLGAVTPTVQAVPDLSVLTDQDYPCFSIEENLPCKGYGQFYLPRTGNYGYGTSPSQFNDFVNIEVANGNGHIYATCPDKEHDPTKIAYRYSVYCGRVMYAQVRWCKQNDGPYRQNSSLLLCKKTCMDYAKSIVDYGEKTCGDKTKAEVISKNIIDKWCSLFTDDEGCIQGVKSEVENCGYSSASLSEQAVEFNPSNSCWAQPDKIEEVKQKASQEISNEKKMGAIRWKVVYPLGSMAIVTILTIIFWIRQKKLYANGYSSLPETEPEYEIIPSEAKPSRDYIHPEDLEPPAPALPRKSSFAVNTLQRTKSTNTKSNILYMVAIYNYHAKMDDELELKAGDRIRVEHKYNDGWAAGINETTNKFGAFPLVCCTDNISSNQEKLPQRSKSRARGNSLSKRARGSVLNKSLGSAAANYSSPLARNSSQQ